MLKKKKTKKKAVDVTATLERIGKIDSRLADLQRAARTVSTLLPRDEMNAALRGAIAHERRRFTKTHNATRYVVISSLLGTLSDPKNPSHSIEALVHDPHDAFGLLAFFLGADLEEKAVKALDGVEWNEGETVRRRVEKDAEAVAETAELLAEREKLVDLANTDPRLSLEHHRETRERHEREAAKRRGDEIRRAAEKRALDRLDASAKLIGH